MFHEQITHYILIFLRFTVIFIHISRHHTVLDLAIPSILTMARYSCARRRSSRISNSSSRSSRGSRLGVRASNVIKNISVRSYAVIQAVLNKLLFLVWFPLLLVFKLLILATAVALYFAYLVYAIGYFIVKRGTGSREDVSIKLGFNNKTFSLLSPRTGSRNKCTDLFFGIRIPFSKFFLSFNTNYSWKFTRDIRR